MGRAQLTGINVIARRIDQGNPLDAMSRISGDLTQGYQGPDGSFTMTGLVPGASYVVYIDQLGSRWLQHPQGAPARTGGVLEFQRYRVTRPWMMHVPPRRSARSGRSSPDPDSGQRYRARADLYAYSLRAGVGRVGQWSEARRCVRHLPIALLGLGQDRWADFPWAGSGFLGAISGNGRVVGGSLDVDVDTPYGPIVQQRAALWTKEAGWKSIANSQFEGCDIFHTSIFDLSNDGSTAVGLAFVDCVNAYAFKWTAKTGMTLLPKTSEEQQCDDLYGGGAYRCEGASRANAVSGSGNVVGGWEEIPEVGGFRVGSIWQGNKQTLLRDPAGNNALGGWIGEVMAVNSAGTIAVGLQSGSLLKDAYKWTPAQWCNKPRPLPRPGLLLRLGDTLQDVCEDRETVAYSVSDDGTVITGESRLLQVGIDDAAIYTPKMGWMLLGLVFPAAPGRARGLPLADPRRVRVGLMARPWLERRSPWRLITTRGFIWKLDQVFVCHGKGSKANTLRVGFPDAMDQHLEQGDTVGFCPGQGPL